jgi:hypothetical protein
LTAHNGEAGARGEIMLQPPQLTFACELDTARLVDLFADSAVIWAHDPEAPTIAVGTTGGGPAIPGSPQMPTLTWEELAGIYGWPGTFATRSSSTASKGASGRASCPGCGRSSGQTSKGHPMAHGPPQPCARPYWQPGGRARIRGQC